MTTIFPLGYGRVSTDRQDLSMEVQTENIQRHSEYEQLGQAEIFFDPDTSGGLPFCEREGGRLLIARVQELVAEGIKPLIIIPKVDRLGRDLVDIDTTVTLLEKMGCVMCFLDLKIDTRTVMGRGMLQIVAVFAQMERGRIKERIQDVMNSKREKGLLTGSVPYGWDAVETGNERTKPGGIVVKERRLVDNLEEQKWIRHMIALWRAGTSYNKIAADLNARGVKTKLGNEWQFGSVKKILHSRTVTEWIQKNNL